MIRAVPEAVCLCVCLCVCVCLCLCLCPCSAVVGCRPVRVRFTERMPRFP